MTFLGEHTIAFPWLPFFFSMAKAVSLIVELVNLVTLYSVNLFIFGMSTFASICFSIELVLYSDGWRRTWWQTIHTMPWLLASSIPQYKYNHHQYACLELPQAVRPFEPNLIDTHQVQNMICKVRLLKSWIQSWPFLEDVITISNTVFEDLECDIGVGVHTLGNWNWMVGHCNVIGHW